MSEIDSRAIISPTARIGNGAKIGPYAIIGDDVTLGENCVLDHHAVVHGPATFGRENHFYTFCAVGVAPQDLTFKSERVSLEAGDRNSLLRQRRLYVRRR